MYRFGSLISRACVVSLGSALFAVAAPVARTAAETATGDVALTPIQRWFFEQDFADVDWWNQAFLFEVASDFGPAAVEDFDP